jgi:general secretion pathway protein A
MYGVQSRKGLTMLTGEPGTGKTALLNALIEELRNSQERINVAFIVNSQIDTNDLFRFIFEEFNINTVVNSKSEYLIELKNFLIKNFYNKVNNLIILDEAQNFSPSLLEEIRLLSNMETEKEKLLQIIIVGQPLLIEKINYPDLYQLKQRLGIIYNLVPLSNVETGLYIRKRLEIAGAQSFSIFHEEAIQEIYRNSNGIPRIINIICDNALLFGFASRSKIIDCHIIKNVAKNIGIIAVKESNLEQNDISGQRGLHGEERERVDLLQKQNALEKYKKNINEVNLERDIIADEIVINREKSFYEKDTYIGDMHDILLKKYKFIDGNDSVESLWKISKKFIVNRLSNILILFIALMIILSFLILREF